MEILKTILLTGADLRDVLISLAISSILGLLIALLYRYTHRGLNYEHTFMAALVMIAPIVSVVMLYIRNDLVLSLGLIGSLSIVRFRTAIKDTRDMAFLFWVIAIGLGSGTFNWGIVVVSSLFILVLVAVLFFIRFGHTLNSDYILILNGRPPIDTDSVRDIIQRFNIEARLRSFDLRDTQYETVFELHLTDMPGTNTNLLITTLKELERVDEVSLMAPQLALPL